MDISDYLKLSEEERAAVRAKLSEGELYALEECLNDVVDQQLATRGGQK